MTNLYLNINQFQSRRKMRKALRRKNSKTVVVRLKSTTLDNIREKAFAWCECIVCFWSCDSEKRRFYFSEPSEAVRFKLTWGGNLS